MANRIDSRLLCQLLQRIGGGQFSGHIRLYADSHRNRFINGDRGQCYWPPCDNWFKIMLEQEELSPEHFIAEQPFPLGPFELNKNRRSTPQRSLAAIQNAGYDWRNQITLASTIYYYFVEQVEDTFPGEERKEKARATILDACKEFHLSDTNLAYLKTITDYKDIIHYLIRRAKNAAGKSQEDDVFVSSLDIRNEVENWEKAIEYRQLSHNEFKQLGDTKIQELTRLFWESDPYIYPAICSLENCFKLVPALFRKNQDRMISLDNIYAGFINDKVVALLLYVKGPLNWSYDALVTLANDRRIKLENTLQKTKDQYFSKYDDVDDNTIQILNLIQCQKGREIDERHSGLLTEHMLNHFFEEHHEACVLYVLEETAGQIEAFHACGFRYVGEKGNGFSADDRDLPCFYMKREAVSD